MSDQPNSLAEILTVELPLIEILDIGAAALSPDRFAPLLDKGKARLTGFEPNQTELAKLQANNSNNLYLPYFLGDGNRHIFYVTRYPGCSSLYLPDPGVIDRFATISAGSSTGNFHVADTMEVQTTRLDDVKLSAKPDYIKLDIQGAELMVLENGLETISETVVLETEVEFLPLYKNQPLFGDIQTYLRKNGFVFHKFLDVSGRGLEPVVHPDNPFLPISQILWADAIFIKNYFDLSSFSDNQLLKAAVILNDVYRSYDVVHALLSEYDQRSNATTAEIYFRHLASGNAPSPQFLSVKTQP